MLDKERVLGKVAELDSYLEELRQIVPDTLAAYQKIEKKRSLERLLQLSIECVIDICKLLVSGLKLGVPSEENDIFEKLRAQGLLSKPIVTLLQDMRAFRNILFHEYATLKDEIVFEKVQNHRVDFQKVKKAILKVLY